MAGLNGAYPGLDRRDHRSRVFEDQSPAVDGDIAFGAGGSFFDFDGDEAKIHHRPVFSVHRRGNIPLFSPLPESFLDRPALLRLFELFFDL